MVFLFAVLDIIYVLLFPRIAPEATPTKPTTPANNDFTFDSILSLIATTIILSNWFIR